MNQNFRIFIRRIGVPSRTKIRKKIDLLRKFCPGKFRYGLHSFFIDISNSDLRLAVAYLFFQIQTEMVLSGYFFEVLVSHRLEYHNDANPNNLIQILIKLCSTHYFEGNPHSNDNTYFQETNLKWGRPKIT